jgi:hypothetical protein
MNAHVIAYMQVLSLRTLPFELECSLMWSGGTIACQYPEPDEISTMLSQPMPLRSFLNLHSPPGLGTPSCFFCSSFEIKISLAFLIPLCSL